MNREKRTAGRIAAILLAAAMVQVCMAGQGDEIVHLDFDDGTVCGFETYIEGGACTLRNDGGRLAADITSCGKLDYANQAFWDGFSLEQNCSYQYSFDISSSIDRKVEYRLQLNGGDYHAYLGDRIDVGTEPVHVSVDWTMTEETDPAPRLVFNMGLQEDMAEDPGEHTVWVDNISLMVLDDSAAAKAGDGEAGKLLSLNQAGYRPEDEKTVFVRCTDEEISLLAAVDESGNRALELSAGEPFYDAASGSQMLRAEFSDLTQPGTWQITALIGDREVRSEPFEIREDAYTAVLKSVFQMLCLQRCGTEVSLPEVPEAEPFAHGVCHDTPALIYGTDRTKDVSGGWHDAGDYGRYVVSGAKAVADLFLAFEEFGLDSDDMGIPESGNGVPDALDEARWELEWMLKMQDDQTGGVYHKITCRSFPGEVAPEEETDELVISPVSLTATLDFAAVMARASVLYESSDPEFAQDALEAACRAWAYGKDSENREGFQNPPEISTGEYTDQNAQDELLWAASELYLAGALSEEEVRNLLSSFGEHGLGWQCVSDYALIDLAFDHKSGEEIREMAKNLLTQYGTELQQRSENDGYYMTLGTDYPWGSNMTAADHGNIFLLTNQLAGDESYELAAKRHLDYLLGANPTTYCYVTGWGEYSPEHPHHRPSQAAGDAMPGMLVGGPNSHLEDPYAQNILAGQAPALCYVDNAQSYSTNETAVYWNSPLIGLLAYYAG